MNTFAGRFVVRFWKEILLVMIFLTIFFGYHAAKITIDTDLTTLLPKDDEYSQKYQELISGDSLGDSVVLVFEVDGNRDRIYAFADKIKGRLEKKVDIVKYFKNMNSISMMGTTGLLLTKGEVFEQLVSTLNFTKFLTENPAALDFSIVRNVGSSLREVEEIFNDVMGIDGIQNFALISEDNEIMVMNIILRKSSLDLDFAKWALEEIREFIDPISQEYGYDYSITGSYQSALDSNRIITNDFAVTTIITLVSITFLFLIVYGNLFTTISIFFSLIIGSLWSLGMFHFLFQGLDFMSSFVMALLLGLGIDFGIHISHRISENIWEQPEQFNSLSPEKKRDNTKYAVLDSVKHSGKSTLIGGITTIAAFMSMFFVDSPALKRVGIMSGIGILIFLAVMIIILPAFLIFFSKWITVRVPKKRVKRWPKRLFNFYHNRGYRYIVITVFILLIPMVFFLVKSFKEFNYTPVALIPGEIESKIAMDKLSEHNVFTSVDNAVLTFIEDPEKLYAAEKAIVERTDALTNINSLASFIPREMVNSYPEFRTEIEKLLGNSQNAFTLMLFKKLDIYNDIDFLLGLLENSPKFDTFIENIFNSKLLPNEAKQFLTTSIDSKMAYKLYAEPSYNIWVNNNLKNFVEEISQSGFDFYGYPIIYYKVMKKVIHSIIFAVLLSGVIIALTVLISLLRFSDTVVVLFSLGITISFLFGVYYLTGMRLNFMTILALPLIMGMAIDGPIHLIGRLREEEQKDEDEKMYKNVFLGTGKAITLSSMTTTLAFFSFVFAASPILTEFGIIMSLGIGINWVVTFFWLKGFRDILRKKRGD